MAAILRPRSLRPALLPADQSGSPWPVAAGGDERGSYPARDTVRRMRAATTPTSTAPMVSVTCPAHFKCWISAVQPMYRDTGDITGVLIKPVDCEEVARLLSETIDARRAGAEPET